MLEIDINEENKIIYNIIPNYISNLFIINLKVLEK